MNIYVDIDETICFYNSDRNYPDAIPSYENIAKTARGTVTKINWFDITEKQLKDWGCKWHNLITGVKPAYDLLICDKTKRIEEL